jgi:DNA polymerase-3 subunit gamma/tau
MLGSVARDSLLDLLLAISAGDTAATWSQLTALVAHNPNYLTVCGQLQELLHDAALQQALGAGAGLLELPQKVIELAACTSAAELQLQYQICLMAARDLALAPDPRIAFEMAVLRLLSFAPTGNAPSTTPAAGGASTTGGHSGASGQRSSAGSALASVAAAGTPAISRDEPRSVRSTPASEPSTSSAAQFTVYAQPSSARSMIAASASSNPAAEQDADALTRFAELLVQLKLTGPLKQLALQCCVRSHSKQRLDLLLPCDWGYILSEHNRAQLLARIAEVEPALSVCIEVGEKCGPTLAEREAQHAQARRQQFVDEIQRDPLVRAAIAQFDAQIVTDSVQIGSGP